MISVIVPTMWRGKEINTMLPLLNEHPLIGEIILIDNYPEEKVESVCNLSKVVYYTTGKNIFPVPSWNYGWETAKYDKLLIINDDVLFDLALVDAIYDEIREDVGTITMHPLNVDETQGKDLTVPSGGSNIYFEDARFLKHKAAVIIGIHKSVYEKIPEELLIHYNDEFLFRIATLRGKSNKSACGNFKCKTNMSSTVRLFNEITNKEAGIFKEIFKGYGICY